MSKARLSSKNVAKSPRAFAINIIIQCNRDAYANDLLPNALSKSSFSDSDKSLITKIVYSTLRNQIRIDSALEKISSKSLDTVDEIALCALRSIGAQLIEDMPAHAVINETVKVMPISLKGFVNAIARKMYDLNSKDKLFIDETPAVKYSLPDWVYKEIGDVFGEGQEEVAKALNTSSKPTLSVFPGLHPGNETESDGDAGEIVKEAILISSKGDITDLDVIKQGKAIVIDQGSQLVVQCLEAEDGENILDLCAAPGGKSFLISKNAAKVVSCDQSQSRMQKLIQTKDRIKADNVYPLVADARTVSFDEEFDRILLDAPCSGLGVLRRRPDARLRISESTVNELTDLQKEIITNAVKLMSDKTVLLYSVCTFTKAETIEIDKWISQEFPELIAQDLSHVSKHLIKVGRGYLLAPGKQNDGMYVIKLRRR